MTTEPENTARKWQGGNRTQGPGTRESRDPSRREAGAGGEGMNGHFREVRQDADIF